jgi:rhodanese-related sulfurtransferase
MTPRSADELMNDARARIDRVTTEQLDGVLSEGGLLIDIRPEAQRAAEGALPGALVVERNVLEWRFDLSGPHHLQQVTGYDQPVVVICSEGYASSFAAASLRELGFARAADLDGGFKAWATSTGSEGGSAVEPSLASAPIGAS